MVVNSISVLKFVGTVSLGLLTGVSYTVSTLALPAILQLPSAASASHALTTLTAALKNPVRRLTSLASASLLLSFILAPRYARHPYLVHTAVLALISSVAPPVILRSLAPPPATPRPVKKPTRQRMDASYEVLGDVHSEAASEEDLEDFNGEETRAAIDFATRDYLFRTAISGLAFATALVGLWGDGTPQTAVYVH